MIKWDVISMTTDGYFFICERIDSRGWKITAKYVMSTGKYCGGAEMPPGTMPR